MHDFQIVFSHPWLLLLLIPALALTLIPYFMLSKKYRRTRNRITSMVLHMCVMVLAISVLSGIRFDYKLSNDQNEILFVVDVSDSQEESFIERDQFLRAALDKVSYDGFKVGIVTFGFDSKYVVPLTANVDRVYEAYRDSQETPDTSASDMAAALRYARTLFQYPETAKIILVTDGKETDEDVLNVIGQITGQGTRLDTVHVSSDFDGDDIQILDVQFPDYQLSVEQNFTINVTLLTNSTVTAQLKLTDNDVECATQTIELSPGTHTVALNHSFDTDGLHKMGFSIDEFPQSYEDGIIQNNVYNTYFNLEVFDKILILERNGGESDALVNLLTEEGNFDVTVLNVYDSEEIPTTVDELRQYDQVILNNISNYDLGARVENSVRNTNMPENFVEMLEEYVSTYGGGMFTIGGKDGENANAYNRTDMYGSLYQQMLPVQAINYTPPLGVIFIIDVSGSMQGDPIELAKTAASSALGALSERDYIGIMTLSTDYEMVLPLTPRTQESKIYSAINNISTGGGTTFPGAIERAGQILRSFQEIERRHIVLVSDALVGDDQTVQYEQLIRDYYDKDGISFSFLGIGMTEEFEYKPGEITIDDPRLNGESLSPYRKMVRAVILGHGTICVSSNITEVSIWSKENLSVPELKEVDDEPFNPTVANLLSPLLSGVETGTAEEGTQNKLTVQLGGFFGVKLRTGADMVLSGDYSVPLYVQWKYLKNDNSKGGMVGSFMCDLNGGEWSGQFMQDANGQTFLLNVVRNLMPTESIRPTILYGTLNEDNYINQLNVYVNEALAENETIRGTIEDMSTGTVISLNETSGDPATDSVYVTLALSSANSYSRSDIVVKKGGVYKIVLQKYDDAGNPVENSLYEIYKNFSYSKEYDLNVEETDIDPSKALLAEIAQKGNGVLVSDLQSPDEILDGFVTEIAKTYDPRLAFIIAAIVLFLLDIAVRKFKFKWLHEIIRERKNKKSQ